MDLLHLNSQHNSGQKKQTSDLSSIGNMITEEVVFGLRDSDISSLSNDFCGSPDDSAFLLFSSESLESVSDAEESNNSAADSGNGSKKCSLYFNL